MSRRADRIARGIKAFVENPFTNLVKGMALVGIGLSEAFRTFREDVVHGQVRVGHGLIIIGVFSILGSLPHLIEGLEAGDRYLEHREKKGSAKEGNRPFDLPLHVVRPGAEYRTGVSHRMRSLLTSTATIEAGTGVALALAPSETVRALLGSPLDSDAAGVIARILGAALVSLGAACWLARDRSASGLVATMLLYNVAAVSLLGHAGIGLGISGVGLLPAIILHILLAIWCGACLWTSSRTSAPHSAHHDRSQKDVPEAS
jgi:hypothetical protein